jgi:DNA invertase Pin-like site-specific DNA recombinase
MAKRASIRRAVGVVRVSRVGDRDGDRFVSPKEQTERIRAIAERDGLKLLDTIEELDVSGGTPLAKRPGLRRAVELVEAGDADVVVVAYFDRLVRSLTVQAEVVERIEQAGGGILAVDVGEVRADTASRWLSSTMLGLVAEYHRRATSERTADAKRRAVMRGVPPFPNIPPGYRQRKDGTLEPDKPADAVAEAFRLRAGGATVMEVREHLRENGVDRSFHGVQALLRSRIPLGELRFGDVVNTSSHEPIVDTETWRRVQRQVVSRGRRPKSERLLARLGVLRCGTCGGRLVIGTTRQGSSQKAYTFYRCSPVGDCPRRVTISADVAETAVVEAVKQILAGVEGTASSDAGITAAREEAERAGAELDAAVRAFSGLDDVDAARERLAALRDARDAAHDRLDDLQEHVLPTVTLTADDWDILTLEEQRDLIRAVVDRAIVASGRGDSRVSVEARS